MELEYWHQHFKKHNEALKAIIKGDPWVFLCGSVTIEYIAKSCYKKNCYTKFVKEYMSKVDERYINFKYKNGKTDLPDQMYYVLRNGLVHAFTMKPLNEKQQHKGRTNSIVLSHNHPHLTPDITGPTRDSCVFEASQFISDIGRAIDLVFEEAKTNKQLQIKMKNRFAKFPPVNAF